MNQNTDKNKYNIITNNKSGLDDKTQLMTEILENIEFESNTIKNIGSMNSDNIGLEQVNSRIGRKRGKYKKKNKLLDGVAITGDKSEINAKLDSSGNINNNEPKKKRRGRRKKEIDLIMKPEDILDYMIKNYPKMGIDQIKTKVLDGLKHREENINKIYVLDKVEHNQNTYYYDSLGNVFDIYAKMVGHRCMFNKKYKIYMFNDSDDDDDIDIGISQFNIS